MEAALWRSGDSSRQQAEAVPPYAVKRPRASFEIPSGTNVPSYNARDSELPGHNVTSDTDSVNASYERYLRSAQISSFGGETRRSTGGLDGLPQINELRAFQGLSGASVAAPIQFMGVGGPLGRSEPTVAVQGQFMGLGARHEIPLPPDASCTLFVEGLPANCSRREVSHIFRPFVGYKEVRLVNKESKRSGGDPWVLCFVDFQSPAHAATAMDALQGYKFDEHDPDSCHLRVQFARSLGARSSGGGHFGKR